MVYSHLAPDGDIMIEEDATIGNIYGGHGNVLDGGDGIHAGGIVTITSTGTTGSIAGGGSNDASGGTGIFSHDSDIQISGNIEAISGGNGYELGGQGIFALVGNISILNGSTIQSITGGESFSNLGGTGIFAEVGSINIVGKVIEISGGVGTLDSGYGIYSGDFVRVAGEVDVIKNGDNLNPAIYAPKYNVFDYTTTGNVQNGFESPGYVVTFNYGKTIANKVLRVYVSTNTFFEKGETVIDGFLGWYTDSKLSSPWIDNSQITDNITLYAKWESNSSNKNSGSSYSLNEKDNNDKKDDKQPIDTPAPVLPIETDGWRNPFVDVSNGDWFYSYVKYVYENNLMSGTDTTHFSPNAFVSRGMAVTVLYRAYGSPDVETQNIFSDINGDEYYAKAVIWAYQNGIVSGMGDGTFSPNASISRQDLMLILTKYAALTEIELTSLRDFVEFADGYLIADYALSAIEDFYRAGLVNGKPNNHFDPLGGATRAEFATILEKLLTLI